MVRRSGLKCPDYGRYHGTHPLSVTLVGYLSSMADVTLGCLPLNHRGKGVSPTRSHRVACHLTAKRPPRKQRSGADHGCGTVGLSLYLDTEGWPLGLLMGDGNHRMARKGGKIATAVRSSNSLLEIQQASK